MQEKGLEKEADTNSTYLIQITLFKVFLDCSPNKLLY